MVTIRAFHQRVCPTLVIALLFCPKLTAQSPNDDSFIGFERLLVLSKTAMEDAHTIHLLAYRISGGLRACDLDALADQVEPTHHELFKIAMDVVAGTPNEKGYAAIVMAPVISSLVAYRTGYQEALESTLRVQAAALSAVGADPESPKAAMCGAWTRNANKLLEGRNRPTEATKR